jgi:hypothetical protein
MSTQLIAWDVRPTIKEAQWRAHAICAESEVRQLRRGVSADPSTRQHAGPQSTGKTIPPPLEKATTASFRRLIVRGSLAPKLGEYSPP